MLECIIILAAAFTADLLLGDPVYRLHPVRLLGYFIAGLEKILFSAGWRGFSGGGMLFAGSVLCALAILLVSAALWRVFPAAGIAAFTFIVYSSIGFRDMIHHALPVEAALKSGNTEKARNLLQRIVGRDTSQLDDEGIARGAVESVAENFVDGFLAVVFWFAAGAVAAPALGLSPAPAATGCALVYRVVNTLDAMVGYRSRPYERFGTVSARADDILNFIPARLSVPVISIAAFICRMDSLGSVKTAIRDRLKHVSPNAGHAESAVAGALGIRLGGPVPYAGKIIEKPWLGEKTRDIASFHISSACRLSYCAGWIGILPVIFLFARFL